MQTWTTIFQPRRRIGAPLALRPFTGLLCGKQLYYLLECDYRDAGLRLQNRHRRGGYGQSTIDAGADPWRTRRHGRALTLGLNQSINLPFSVRTWAAGTIALIARHGVVTKLMVVNDRNGQTSEYCFKLSYSGSAKNLTFTQWLRASPPPPTNITISSANVWLDNTWALLTVSWGPLGTFIAVNRSYVGNNPCTDAMRDRGDVVRVHRSDGTQLAPGLQVAWLAVWKDVQLYPAQLDQILTERFTLPET